MQIKKGGKEHNIPTSRVELSVKDMPEVSFLEITFVPRARK